MPLEKNVGGMDRLLRGVVGIALLVVAIAAFAGGRLVLAAGTGIAAAGLLFSVVVQFCSVNALLGIDTCSVDPEPDD